MFLASETVPLSAVLAIELRKRMSSDADNSDSMEVEVRVVYRELLSTIDALLDKEPTVDLAALWAVEGASDSVPDVEDLPVEEPILCSITISTDADAVV